MCVCEHFGALKEIANHIKSFILCVCFPIVFPRLYYLLLIHDKGAAPVRILACGADLVLLAAFLWWGEQPMVDWERRAIYMGYILSVSECIRLGMDTAV